MATQRRWFYGFRLGVGSRLKRGATTKLDCYGLTLVLKEQVRKIVHSRHFLGDFCSTSNR